MYKKLFIPGPTHVRPEILQAQAVGMIGHRAKEYQELQASVTPKLQKLLYTQQRVYLYASSSSGIMEGAVRQASLKRMLVTICGAFSKRWYEMVVANGIPCDKLEVPLGQAITPELVDEALSKGTYDAITLTHNETATGIMMPLQATAELIRTKYPDVLILVDAVSSMAGVKIEFDAWGLDVLLAGVQKCFALPPGLAVCAVSDRARARALQVPNRGHYFAYDQMDKKYDVNQTPATPAVSIIQALDTQLDDMFAEGLEARFARHLEMAEIVRAWARKHWALYGDQRYLSNTVTNIANTRNIAVGDLNKELGKRGAMISNGYGDLKEKCFRIGHMGDLTVADIRWLLSQIDDILKL
ncbi:MAG TPA: alanine--glyoxylate aminotransferase family protein [Anaerolineae bacterium]|nr:alanine--glyoxylate aminotransferase family protein [Anaerolineae bacterium]